MKLRWRIGTGDWTPYKAEGGRGTYRIYDRGGRIWSAWVREPGRRLPDHLGDHASPKQAREACQQHEEEQ